MCLALLGALVLTACAEGARSTKLPSQGVAGSASGATSTAPAMLRAASAEIKLPSGFQASVYAEGLQSPTSMAWGPDGKLYITQLSGGENAGMGQVVVVGSPGARPRRVLNGLAKPTGLVWREQDLYIVAGRNVLRASRLADGEIDVPIVVVRDLPFNTRSEGQIDLLPDGRLVFEASGDVRDPGSGRLLSLLPGDQPEVLATGLKNAYAYAVDPQSGRVFTTDIADDRMNGDMPPEEINLVEPGADYGWPRCYGDQEPAMDRGGSLSDCAKTQTPVVTFPVGTTPAGLGFHDGALWVALWNGEPPQVARVTLVESTKGLSGNVATFMTGVGRPIDVLPEPSGALLVLDFQSGVVYRVYRKAGKPNIIR